MDAPFSALSPQHSAQRRGEQRELLERFAELAQREEAQLVLLAGDLLDGDHVYYETAQALAQALGRIKARVFLAPGNHDFYASRALWNTMAWPENVHIFKRESVESVFLPELGCSVHGAAFTAPYRENSPLAGFTAPEDGGIHIFCTHGEVNGKGRYGSILPREIAESGLDYLALGHVHACSGLQREGKTGWAYSGCPEGRGFDELGEKGVLRGEVSRGSVCADFLPLAGRRYEILTVDVSDKDPAAALVAALPQGAQRDIYRVLLTGESDAGGLDLSALEERSEPYFYSVSLRDQTHIRRDLWSRADEDTLTGLFLRTLRGRVEAADGEAEREKLEKAVRFGLAALEEREEPFS